LWFCLTCFVSDVELSLEYLREKALQFQSSYWAKTTKKSLNTQQKAFISFAQQFEIFDFNQVSGETLIQFSLWLVATNRLNSVAAIRNYLSSVRTLCSMFGKECHTPKSYPSLDWTLQGLRRELRTPSQKKYPVTPDILFNLLSSPASILTPPTTLPWDKRVLFNTTQVFFLLSFYTMLRASNLLPTAYNDVDPDRQLTWGKIKRHFAGLVFKITLSKTNQFMEHVHEVALPHKSRSIFCPVSALSHLFRFRNGVMTGDNDLVFLVPSSGTWRPLLKAQVVKIFKCQLKRMKLDPTRYGCHSFRHGAIQAAVRAQPSLELVRLQSGHSSDAILVYTAMPAASRMVTGALMLEELSRGVPSVPPA
jgi:integrase